MNSTCNEKIEVYPKQNNIYYLICHKKIQITLRKIIITKNAYISYVSVYFTVWELNKYWSK